ncbi:hypothetical protein ACFWF3_17375, partial [Nocardia sp. NPDC060220]
MAVVDQIVAAAETVIPDLGIASPGSGNQRSAAESDRVNAPEVAFSLDGAVVDLGDRIPPLRGAPPEEVGVIARWLAKPGARIVRTSDGYHEPLHGAARWVGWAQLARTAATTRSEQEEYLAER